MTVTPLHPGISDTRLTPELFARLVEAVAPAPGPTPAPEVVYVPAPEGAPTDAPRVFAAINDVMRDAMPVGKNQRNEQQNYAFRGIDDVMSAMAGPMRAHGVFILPTIAEHTQQRDGKMTRTLITMRYRVYGPAGDCLVAEVPGEAFDYADKSMNKAQSAALKYLLFTLFMLPVDGRSIDDGDRHHPEPTPEQCAEQQQRQQDRRQQRGQGQQRQQQPRRSNRAEAGPWEQPPAQQAAPPRRDYLAEATKAPNRKAFDKVRADAVKAGAPAEFLARLDAVARQKANAANQPQRHRDPEPGDQPQQGAASTGQDQEQPAALGEMYDAARAAGVDQAEADQLFSSRYGCAPAAGTAEQLREQRDDLLDAAKGGTP
ncbi:ERF family protein [Streptomyces sp. NBC_01142]|uniref:ERF family protein n=1 Tax=Streptomyces sp. NBC_01142 TaxID=2975865 RepID=UPI00225102C1|nr:ERF family protein [Streptomyces sp. NBC_01142]MCX4824218.1 ERF family protein [Streptomyces sp. NBC_01142]